MSAVEITVCKCFEAGLSEQEIAEEIHLPVEAVKLCLRMHVPRYGETDMATEFSGDEKATILAGIKAIALDKSVDSKTQLRALMYLRDDHKGRHDGEKKVLKSLGLLALNAAAEAARQKTRQALGQGEPIPV